MQWARLLVIVGLFGLSLEHSYILASSVHDLEDGLSNIPTCEASGPPILLPFPGPLPSNPSLISSPSFLLLPKAEEWVSWQAKFAPELHPCNNHAPFLAQGSRGERYKCEMWCSGDRTVGACIRCQEETSFSAKLSARAVCSGPYSTPPGNVDCDEDVYITINSNEPDWSGQTISGETIYITAQFGMGPRVDFTGSNFTARGDIVIEMNASAVFIAGSFLASGSIEITGDTPGTYLSVDTESWTAADVIQIYHAGEISLDNTDFSAHSDIIFQTGTSLFISNSNISSSEIDIVVGSTSVEGYAVDLFDSTFEYEYMSLEGQHSMNNGVYAFLCSFYGDSLDMTGTGVNIDRCFFNGSSEIFVETAVDADMDAISLISSTWESQYADLTFTGTCNIPAASCKGIVVNSCTFSGAALDWNGSGQVGVDVSDTNFINVTGEILVEGANDYCLGQDWENNVFTNCSELYIEASLPEDLLDCFQSALQWRYSLFLENSQIYLQGSGTPLGSVEDAEVVHMENLVVVADMSSTMNLFVSASGKISTALRAEFCDLDQLEVSIVMGPSLQSWSRAVWLADCLVTNSVFNAELAYLEGDSFQNVEIIHVDSDGGDIYFANVEIEANSPEEADFTGAALVGVQFMGMELLDYDGGSITVNLKAGDTNTTALQVVDCVDMVWQKVDVILSVESDNDATGFFASGLNNFTMRDVSLFSLVSSLNAEFEVNGIILENTEFVMDNTTLEAHIAGEPVNSCTGIIVRSTNISCDRSVKFYPYSELDCTGILWEEVRTFKISENAIVDLVGETDGVGVKVMFALFDLPALNIYGDASQYGVDLSYATMAVIELNITGMGETGIRWYSNSGSSLNEKNPIWRIHAIAYGDIAISANYFIPGTVPSASTFIVTGSGMIQVSDILDISWKTVTLEIPATATNVFITTADNVTVSSLNSTTGYVVLGVAGGTASIRGPADLVGKKGLTFYPTMYLGPSAYTFTSSPTAFNAIFQGGIVGDSSTVTINCYTLLLYDDAIGLKSLTVLARRFPAGNIQIQCQNEFLLRAATVYQGPLSISAKPLRIESTQFDLLPSFSILNDCYLSPGSNITGPVTFDNPAGKFRIEGTIMSTASLVSGLLSGDGYIETVNASTGSIIQPRHHDGVLHIGQLNGDPTYIIEINNNASSKLLIDNRTDDLEIDFVTYSAWQGQDLLPVLQPSNYSRLQFNITNGIAPIIEGQRLSIGAVDARASYLRADSEMRPAFALAFVASMSPSPSPSISPSVSISRSSTKSNTPTTSTTVSPSVSPSSVPPSLTSTPTVSLRLISPLASVGGSPLRTLVSPPTLSKPLVTSTTVVPSPSVRSTFTGLVLPPENRPTTFATRGLFMPSVQKSPSRFAPSRNLGVPLLPQQSIGPSRSLFPLAANLCSSCEYGSFQIPLSDVERQSAEQLMNPNQGLASAKVRMDIPLDDGRSVGSIVIPPSITSDPNNDITLQIVTMTVDRTDRGVNGGQRLGSAVVDITLLSSAAGIIHKLDEPLTICLQADDEMDKEERCLGYYNEDKRKWECEDQCLEQEGNTYCGKTEHLTSFALLLGGGNKKCGDEYDELVLWLSVGFVGGAIVVVVIAAVTIEIYVQAKRIKQKRFLRKLAKSSQITPSL